MKLTSKKRNNDNRYTERGAALVTTLLVATLLLAAGGALLLTTSMAGTLAVDGTAEMQAYYGAEAGVQSALNVLRGNIAPDGSMPAGTKISFRNAVTLSTSNLSTDTATNYRLSGWLNYNYTPSGASNPDRVVLSPTSGYTPQTGLAYSVDVSDPDNIPVASGEPFRLLVRVTGYGPKGAVKRFELVVRRMDFNYDPPATIMMRGADDCSAVTFTTGNSAAKSYSGHDNAGAGVIPAFGATCAGDKATEISASNKNTVDNPKADTFANSSLPAWLQSADQARAFLADQKAMAMSMGQYFSSFSGYAGTNAQPAFTFVDGDCTLSGGAGLLIVTGNLTMNGNPSFNGVILVLGNGSVNRDGGGNGNIFGAMAVARFDPVGPGGFLAPTFNTNGGGNSTMQFDSSAVRNALNFFGAAGVHEY